jgi:hypothetical protein
MPKLGVGRQMSYIQLYISTWGKCSAIHFDKYPWGQISIRRIGIVATAGGVPCFYSSSSSFSSPSSSYLI